MAGHALKIYKLIILCVAFNTVDMKDNRKCITISLSCNRDLKPYIDSWALKQIRKQSVF